MTMGASTSGPSQRYYTVKPGDTLSKISKQFYGDANQYTRYSMQIAVPARPNTINPGQELVIPE